jgi:hypothetical protein
MDAAPAQEAGASDGGSADASIETGPSDPDAALDAPPSDAAAPDGAPVPDGPADDTGTSCVPGAPCMPDPCHIGRVDGCEGGVVACEVLGPAPDGTSCDDGDACTTGDRCSQGACGGSPVTCAAPDDCHTDGVCQPMNGACRNPAKPDDTPCGTGMVCEDGLCGCPAMCGGACVSTKGDPANCGRCGHGCQAGGCAGGACQPFVLAPGGVGPENFGGIAVDAQSVYWTRDKEGTLLKVPVDGGAVVTLASGETRPTDIAIDATNVYFNSETQIMKVPIGGGTVTELATGAPLNIALDGANVYWTVYEGNTQNAIGKVPIAGGATTTFVSNQGGALGIAVDATNVYWTDSTGGNVMRMPIAGGAITTVASGRSYPEDIAVDVSNVYWLESVTSGAFMKAPLDGGAPIALASGQDYPYGLAIDETNAYWGTSNKRLMQVPLAGGAQTQLAVGEVAHVAVDATSLYYTTYDGAVMKLAKP